MLPEVENSTIPGKLPGFFLFIHKVPGTRRKIGKEEIFLSIFLVF